MIYQIASTHSADITLKQFCSRFARAGGANMFQLLL